MTRVSPCVPWCEIDDLPDSCTDVAVTPETLTKAIAFASDVLYNLTKRRWSGSCTDTYRPTEDDACFYPRMIDGKWANVGYYEDVVLPANDVTAITSVKINGGLVDPGLYGLRDRKVLYAKRQPDGSYLQWPTYYNDPHADSSAPSTMEIVYVHGAAPPPSMVTAAALLSWEFAVAWTPDCTAGCRLPQRVTTITRAGVTFAIIDPLSVFEKGMVGVPDIDALIQSVNYGETRQRSFVGRPGRPTSAFRQ